MKGVRRRRNVPVPEAPVAGFLMGGVLHVLRPWSLPIDPPATLAFGSSLLIAGLVLVGWSVSVVGRQPIDSPTTLVTAGPYRYSRNPMYVGWTVGYLGLTVLADTTWPLALLPVVVALIHRAVRREERALEARFGDEYRDYRRAVRRYL